MLALKKFYKLFITFFIRYFDQSDDSLFTLRMSFIEGDRTFCHSLKIND